MSGDMPKGWLREEIKRAQARSAKVPAWARPVYTPPRAAGNQTSPRGEAGMIRERFDRDAAQWLHETMIMSSVTDIVMNPAYQRIIGLGPAAVPLIIERLRQEPEHWFWALTAIIGEDHAAGATTIPEAARRWISWYENQPSTRVVGNQPAQEEA